MSIEPFTSADFRISPKSLFVSDLVGKGNFSKVFKGLFFGTVVAIKKQDITDPEFERYLLNELAILRFCKHPYIVKFIGAAKPSDNIVWNVTEFIPGGDLRMLLNSSMKQKITWKHKVDIMQKTAEAITYLHQNFVIHRDIKTDNIMLTLDLVPKLIDLGFAREVKRLDPHDEMDETMTTLGTDDFMAPEVNFGLPYYLPADVFSYGITLFEVCSGIIPKRTPQNGFCMEWDDAKAELSKQKTPESLVLLIEQTASDQVHERIDMKGVVEWLAELSHDLKGKVSTIHLAEDDIMNQLQAKWEHILANGDDPNSQVQIETSDLENKFLQGPEDKLSKEMMERRKSVNKMRQKLLERSEQRSETDAGFRDDDTVSDNVSELPVPQWKPRDTDIRDAGDQMVSPMEVVRQPMGNLKKSKSKAMMNGSGIMVATTKFFKNMGGSNKKKNTSVSISNEFSSPSPESRSPKRPRAAFSKLGYVNRKYQFAFVSWKKEWLVLSEEGLLYFKNQEGQKQADVKGAILFMDMTAKIETRKPALICSVAQAGKPNCFMILTNERKKIFQAETKQERDDWIRRINKGFQAWYSDQLRQKLNY